MAFCAANSSLGLVFSARKNDLYYINDEYISSSEIASNKKPFLRLFLNSAVYII